MFVAESRQSRQLIVRLPRGADLVSALQRLFAEHDVRAGWIQGLGAFERVELCEYDQRALRYEPARRIDRPVELLHLEGNVSLRDGAPFPHLHATVSYETQDGIVVLGGHLTSARVFACELRVTVFEDVTLERQEDPATGLSLWPLGAGTAGAGQPEDPGAGEDGAVPDPWAAVARVSESAERADEAASSRGDGPVGWGDVAAASRPAAPEPPAWKAPEAPPRPSPRSGRAEARRRALREARTPAPVPEPISRPRRAAVDFDEPLPEPGDYLDHFRFGLCRVEDEDPEGGVQVRMPSGVRRTIRLDLLRVEPPEERDGKRVFPVRRRR